MAKKKDKAANCVYLLTKCIDYPEGYCLKKAKPIYEGINKDCGRLCWGTSSSYYKEKIAGGKEGD